MLLPLLLIGFVLHRGYYVRKRGPEADSLKKREIPRASRLAGFLGLVGLAASSMYVARPDWIAWAAATLPVWGRWAGIGTALLGFGLLQWAQISLGSNWSDTPRMIAGQVLVTSGPYKFIRHPIYAAFLLILGSTLLISSNWLVGAAWTSMTLVEALSRVSYEESLMLEFFGDQYRAYMTKTGRLLPRISGSSAPGDRTA